MAMLKQQHWYLVHLFLVMTAALHSDSDDAARYNSN
jgi:hypothetical protein